MKIELKDIIIICLLLILVYLYFDKIKKIYKNIKKKYFGHKELEIKSDLSHMKKEQEIIQAAIKENIYANVKDKKLREIVMYSLSHGKKVRPIIVTTIFKRLNNENKESNKESNDYVMQAAIAIEYIHTASLIIDDIMDDDDYRRGKEALHVKYNLTLAQLGAVLLFSLGMENIFESLNKLTKVIPETNKNIILITGNLCSSLLKELTTGQYLDVDMPTDIPAVGDLVKDAMRMNKLKYTTQDIIHKKTSSLFEYTFIVPWILSNSTKSDDELTAGIEKMRLIARKFGLMFQISDDFEDVEQDKERDGKNITMNYVINSNYYDAYQDYNKLVQEFNEAAENILSPEIIEMEKYLTKRVEVYYKDHLKKIDK